MKVEKDHEEGEEKQMVQVENGYLKSFETKGFNLYIIFQP